MLSRVQTDVLLKPIRADRVKKTQGNSYLEAWDVIAYLTKVFGFEGWDKEIISLDPIFETPGKSRDGSKDVWTVAYRCDMRLTIRDPQGERAKIIDDVGTGEAINQPSRGDAHDLAAKSAVSSALKRCAKDLGDQFGLGLYDNGSLAPCLGRVVIYEPRRDGQEDDGTTTSAPPDSPLSSFQGDGSPDSAADGHAGAKVDPPVSAETHPELLTTRQRDKIFATARDKKIDAHVAANQVVGRVVGSLNELTKVEGIQVIDFLTKLPVPA
jgi:hypothetical protein